MPKKLKRAAAIERAETPGLPKAEPNRLILKRIWTNADGSEDRTIDLVEQVKPGLLRTYRETRTFGPDLLPVTPKPTA